MNALIEANKDWIDATWEKVDKKLQVTAVRSRDKIPYTAVNGVHDDGSGIERIGGWTNGFWGGLMWLMYHATGNEDYRKTAERSEEYLDNALKNYRHLDHDVGFIWHLVSGANYRLTGNQASCVRNLYAASTLFSRYNIDGDFIRAWNAEKAAGYSIIDTLMNLSLLYWASDEIGDDRFKMIAMRHMDMAMRDHIRPDGSVNHIVEHETHKVGVKCVHAGQGYSETSCWSRGLSWAVYGSVISYIHTGKKEYLEAAKKTADYFIKHSAETDYLPLVDFCAPPTPVYYDSTAGMIAASGMLEIAKYVSGEESAKYTQGALDLLKACDSHFCNYDVNVDPLVLMGTESYGRERGTHIPIIYGDFFFVDALLKLRGSDFFIW